MEDALIDVSRVFFRWFRRFLEALVTLGVPIFLAMWWALTTALDDRYAPLSLAEQVQTNGTVATAVQGQLKVLSDVVIGEAAFAKKIQYCSAAANGDAVLRNELDRQLGVLITQYKALVGRDPYLPEC